MKQLFFEAIRKYSDGELSEAVRVLREAQELDPANRDVRETLERAQQELEAARRESQGRKAR